MAIMGQLNEGTLIDYRSGAYKTIRSSIGDDPCGNHKEDS
jgi:hypothetical protein